MKQYTLVDGNLVEAKDGLWTVWTIARRELHEQEAEAKKWMEETVRLEKERLRLEALIGQIGASAKEELAEVKAELKKAQEALRLKEQEGKVQGTLEAYEGGLLKREQELQTELETISEAKKLVQSLRDLIDGRVKTAAEVEVVENGGKTPKKFKTPRYAKKRTLRRRHKYTPKPGGTAALVLDVLKSTRRYTAQMEISKAIWDNPEIANKGVDFAHQSNRVSVALVDLNQKGLILHDPKKGWRLLST